MRRVEYPGRNKTTVWLDGVTGMSSAHASHPAPPITAIAISQTIFRTINTV
jgi:hypothetical protein